MNTERQPRTVLAACGWCRGTGLIRLGPFGLPSEEPSPCDRCDATGQAEREESTVEIWRRMASARGLYSPSPYDDGLEALAQLALDLIALHDRVATHGDLTT